MYGENMGLGFWLQTTRISCSSMVCNHLFFQVTKGSHRRKWLIFKKFYSQIFQCNPLGVSTYREAGILETPWVTWDNFYFIDQLTHITNFNLNYKFVICFWPKENKWEIKILKLRIFINWKKKQKSSQVTQDVSSIPTLRYEELT